MTTDRPGFITTICILGFMGIGLALIGIPITYTALEESVGEWYPPYLIFCALVYLACLIGLWLMKKWSIITYSAMIVINQVVVVLVLEMWNIFALIINAVVITVVFSKYEEME